LGEGQGVDDHWRAAQQGAKAATIGFTARRCSGQIV